MRTLVMAAPKNINSTKELTFLDVVWIEFRLSSPLLISPFVIHRLTSSLHTGYLDVYTIQLGCFLVSSCYVFCSSVVQYSVVIWSAAAVEIPCGVTKAALNHCWRAILIPYLGQHSLSQC
jgi:hypothetical protein